MKMANETGSRRNSINIIFETMDSLKGICTGAVSAQMKCGSLTLTIKYDLTCMSIRNCDESWIQIHQIMDDDLNNVKKTELIVYCFLIFLLQRS